MHRFRSLLHRHGHRRSIVALGAFFALLFALLVFSPVWLHARSSSGIDISASDATVSSNYREITLGWFDASRKRNVPARLFWPNSARQGVVPLVLFSHGIGSSDDGYTHLGRYWASHGIASLHVRHVGSDRSMWEGNPLQVVQQIERATSDMEAIARAADLRWALDHVLAERYGAHIDLTRIVVAGHSYGANTAMLAVGARVVRDGQVLQLADARIAAGILISAPPFYGDSDFAPIVGGIEIPTLHVTTTEDVIRLPGFGSGVADREKIFDAMGGDKTLAIFDRGSHNVFTDRRYFDTLEVADSVKASTQRLTLAFLQSLNSRRGGRFAALAALKESGLVMRRAVAASPQVVAANSQRIAQPLPMRIGGP